MKRQVIAVIICFSIIISLCLQRNNIVKASEIESQDTFIIQEGENPAKEAKTDIMPCWNYTAFVSQGLSITKSGTAICSSYITGGDNVKRISSYMYLQYYNKSGGYYENVSGASWSKMVNEDLNDMQKEFQLTKSGTYRVKVVHYVYTITGENEEVIDYSLEKTYTK